MTRNIAVLGGSSPFTAGLIESVLDHRPPVTPARVTLIGRNEINLRIVAEYARRRLGPAGWEICSTTDTGEGLAGADIVIHQIRYGGWDGRRQDERLAAACNVATDETLGPAALASLARIFSPLHDICARIVDSCPDALVINMTNPLSVVTALMLANGVKRCVGLCELPRVTVIQAATVLGINYSQLDWDYAGLNHRGFITRLTGHGRDQIPELVAKLALDTLAGVTAAEIEEFGAIPTKYFRLLRPLDANMQIKRFSRADLLSSLANRVLEEMETVPGDAPASLGERYMAWYPHALVPFLHALSGPKPVRLEGNIVSDSGVVEEGRLTVSPDGIGELEQGVGSAPVRAWIERFRRHESRVMAMLSNPSAESIRAAVYSDPLIPADKEDICARAIVSTFEDADALAWEVGAC